LIIDEILKYHREYNNIPTMEVFKVRLSAVNNELLKTSIVDQLRSVYQKLSASDLQFISEQYLEFCKNQQLKSAIVESVDLLRGGQYEQIKHLVDTALKAGMQRNVGHDYIKEVESRLNEDARCCVKTNWKLIDELMDGGLASGELGVVIGSAGGGKCVGPNTKIDIKYHEFGVEFTDRNGNPRILWISPFDKYKIDDIELSGWQVENVFWEINRQKEIDLNV
jgi:hypothetical protein